jgi:hypothetical protein
VTESLANVPRFLVVAPVGRDGELICGLLNRAGYRAQCVQHVREVATVDSALLLGLILTDEALLPVELKISEK